MTFDDLEAAWAKASAGALATEMQFDDGRLMLGARTVLAKAGAPVDETALAARLAAAHGRSVGDAPLRHVHRAVETWRKSDEALALMHLALSGLAKLQNPKPDARRLFVADALIRSGVAPSIIAEAVGFGHSAKAATLDKHNPDQPRVPAGNPDGGRWTSAEEAGATGATATKPAGVQDGDASATRGREVASDASRQSSASPAAVRSGPSAVNDRGHEVAQNFDSDETCSSFIAANCQARILRVFPGEYLACTLRELQAAADAGDPAARKACKLLKRNQYRK